MVFFKNRHNRNVKSTRTFHAAKEEVEEHGNSISSKVASKDWTDVTTELQTASSMCPESTSGTNTVERGIFNRKSSFDRTEPHPQSIVVRQGTTDSRVSEVSVPVPKGLLERDRKALINQTRQDDEQRDPSEHGINGQTSINNKDNQVESLRFGDTGPIFLLSQSSNQIEEGIELEPKKMEKIDFIQPQVSYDCGSSIIQKRKRLSLNSNGSETRCFASIFFRDTSCDNRSATSNATSSRRTITRRWEHAGSDLRRRRYSGSVDPLVIIPPLSPSREPGDSESKPSQQGKVRQVRVRPVPRRRSYKIDHLRNTARSLDPVVLKNEDHGQSEDEALCRRTKQIGRSAVVKLESQSEQTNSITTTPRNYSWRKSKAEALKIAETSLLDLVDTMSQDDENSSDNQHEIDANNNEKANHAYLSKLEKRSLGYLFDDVDDMDSLDPSLSKDEDDNVEDFESWDDDYSEEETLTSSEDGEISTDISTHVDHDAVYKLTNETCRFIPLCNPSGYQNNKRRTSINNNIMDHDNTDDDSEILAEKEHSNTGLIPKKRDARDYGDEIDSSFSDQEEREDWSRPWRGASTALSYSNSEGDQDAFEIWWKKHGRKMSCGGAGRVLISAKEQKAMANKWWKVHFQSALPTPSEQNVPVSSSSSSVKTMPRSNKMKQPIARPKSPGFFTLKPTPSFEAFTSSSLALPNNSRKSEYGKNTSLFQEPSDCKAPLYHERSLNESKLTARKSEHREKSSLVQETLENKATLHQHSPFESKLMGRMISKTKVPLKEGQQLPTTTFSFLQSESGQPSPQSLLAPAKTTERSDETAASGSHGNQKSSDSVNSGRGTTPTLSPSCPTPRASAFSSTNSESNVRPWRRRGDQFLRDDSFSYIHSSSYSGKGRLTGSDKPSSTQKSNMGKQTGQSNKQSFRSFLEMEL